MIIEEESCEVDTSVWSKLNDGMVETILVLLPVLNIFSHCRLVCKRWDAIIGSRTFTTALKQALIQRPWIFIFDSVHSSHVIYDMVGFDYVHARYIGPPDSDQRVRPCHPLVKNSGLVCYFQSQTQFLITFNPFNGGYRILPRWCAVEDIRFTRVVAMYASATNYQVFVIHGKHPYPGMRIFSLEENKAFWRPLRYTDNNNEFNALCRLQIEDAADDIDPGAMKGVTVMTNEGLMVCFLMVRGTLVCFDTRKSTFTVYPKLLGRQHPSSDVVEYRGRLFFVTIMGPVPPLAFQTTLHVWEFNIKNAAWKHISAMPANLLLNYDVDPYINCSSHGDQVVVCVNSISLDYINHVLIFNVSKNTWADFSPKFGGKDFRKIVWAYCIEPKPELKV